MMQTNRTRWLRPLAYGAAVLVVLLVARDARAQGGCCSGGGAGGGPEGGPGGIWRGKWSSQSSGHQGPLGARIRPSGPDRYTAWFYGRFAGVIPFAYRTSLHRVPGTADVYHSRKRMPLLGTYETTAQISGGSFRADFVGSQDRGVFTMSRRR